MNPNITKIIDQYLSGELSAEDKVIFEERMANNTELKEEVDLQKAINEGAKRAAQRTKIKKTGRNYHYKKLLKWSGMSAIALAIATAATLYIISPSEDVSNEIPDITSGLIEELEEFAQLDNLPIQYFPIAENGGVVLSAKGVLLSIPKEAFMLNGKPYLGQVVVQYQEAISGSDIVKSGLNTMSGDRLLETQGMFGVGGFTPDGKQLDFNPKVGVYVQTPVDEYKDKMQLFDGVKKADGSIDWQNPKPLAKIPVPIDMKDLDFYPGGYEGFLDEKKWKQSKKSRDSLYLSLEEESITSPNVVRSQESLLNETPSMKILPEERDYLYGTNRPININMTIEETSRLSKWKEGPRYESIFKYYNIESSPEYNPSRVGQKPESGKPSNDPRVNEASVEAEAAVTSYKEFASADSIAIASSYYLSPSKVLAFWNKKFNNTNLATREFERRVRVIHGKCFDADRILKKYTSQLGKPMWKIDKEVASMGHPEFKDFAAENVGVMNVNNPHIKGLQAFYEKGIKKLKAQNKIYQDLEKKRRGNWDEDLAKERRKEHSRKVNREAQAFEQEYDFNLKDVKKHLGYTKGFTIKHGKGPVIKNIDAYVREATQKRRTTTIVDPLTGNTTKIKYNKIRLEVENADKYQKLYVYLFPSKIKSYQRISGKGGKFDYNLNDAMVYDLAVVGITETGYNYLQKMSVKGGDLGKVKLKGLTETDLEASIKQLNGKRTSRPMKINNELQWLVKEKKDYKEQKTRKNMAAFREALKCVIFSCHSCATETRLTE